MAVKQTVSTDRAPQAIGPYSQAVRAGDLLFVSGQIPLDPATGDLVAGPIEAQTRQVMENLKAILEAAGLGMERVVKTTIYLADLDTFAAVNAVYGEYFASDPPARATVEVCRLPRGAGIEIDAVALLAGPDAASVAPFVTAAEPSPEPARGFFGTAVPDVEA